MKLRDYLVSQHNMVIDNILNKEMLQKFCANISLNKNNLCNDFSINIRSTWEQIFNKIIKCT